jgi:signal transduction histidine kinase
VAGASRPQIRGGPGATGAHEPASPHGWNASGHLAQKLFGLAHWDNLRRYGLAMVSVSVALGVALLLQHVHFHDSAVPLLLFADAVTAWYGGTGSALVAVVLSTLGFDYFFLPPIYSLSISSADIPYFVLFFAFASLLSWFATIRRRVEEDLRATRDKLQLEVAERARLNTELVKRSAALEASNKELEAFAYSISHDLRAPLRHVAGFAELLKNSAGAALGEKSQHYLTVILEAANKMGALIDDLLAFSRISRAEAHHSAVSLEQLVQEVVLEVGREADQRKITWKIDPLPEWYGDRSMLRLVLVNLISNAVKFTRTRSQAEVEIGCSELKDDQVVLFVRDNGVGFDMKYANKLFGVFQRLHPQEDFEGTGIGLATVQRIVHRHGGHVWAESIVDGGATFYFSLSKKHGV